MLAVDFATLFQGNRLAHGSDTGGCVRGPINWQKHLSGEEPSGIYPMVYQDPNGAGDWYVHWGCADFDIKSDNHPSYDFETEQEAHEAAVTLAKVLAKFGITGWIERTRSCGRHVWLFADAWVPAVIMRRALLVACEIAEVPTREVNPKQEELAEGQLGNYVRLPYPGPHQQHYLGNRKQVIVAPDDAKVTWYTVEEFVPMALQQRSNNDAFEAVATLWRAPARPEIVYDPTLGEGTALNRAGRHVLVNGPDDGDRSRGLFYVAYQCKLSGLSPEQCMGLLKLAHWNKFEGRPDEDKRLMEVIEGAYR